METVACKRFRQYDCRVELGVIAVIVALFVLGTIIPTEHTLPRQSVCLPYTKEIKVLYRIWAAWRVERVAPNADALTQHFEVLTGAAPYYQTRKVL